MNRHTGIIVGVIVLALVAGGVVYIKNTGNTATPPLIPIVPATSTIPVVSIPTTKSYYVPKYTEDGKIDTSDWITLVGTSSGFSLRAPKEHSGIGWGPRTIGTDHFSFTLDEEGTGLYAICIVKNAGTDLSNWVDKYIVLHPEKILDQKIVTLGQYRALEFKVAKWDDTGVEKTGAYMESSYYYPDFYENSKKVTGSGLPDMYRYTVVDVGDRYIFFQIDATSTSPYLDVKDAIISSLKVFPPKPQE